MIKIFKKIINSLHKDNKQDKVAKPIEIKNCDIPQECPAEPEEIVEPNESEEQYVPDTLLDNAPFMSLAEQCSEMLKELDVMYKQIPNDQVKNLILQQKTRIREALLLSGATLIDEEPEFNLLRHQSVDGGIVKNGTTITETEEPGVEIEGRVMVKAKVEI